MKNVECIGCLIDQSKKLREMANATSAIHTIYLCIHKSHIHFKSNMDYKSNTIDDGTVEILITLVPMAFEDETPAPVGRTSCTEKPKRVICKCNVVHWFHISNYHHIPNNLRSNIERNTMNWNKNRKLCFSAVAYSDSYNILMSFTS